MPACSRPYPTPDLCRTFVRRRSGSASEDHVIDDVVVFCALVRPNRLAIIRDVVNSEPPVEADLAIARVGAEME